MTAQQRSGRKNKQKPRAKGQLNRSQLITTYGPGAMLDLPDESVLIPGLNHWQRGRKITEPRLIRYLQNHLGLKKLSLHEPPLDDEGDTQTGPGINTLLFPLWFVGLIDETLERDGKTYRTRPLFKHDYLQSGKAHLPPYGKMSVTPLRFVRACENGHLDDIDWYYFLYGAEAKPHRGEQLWLDEGGSGNDLSEVFIRNDDGTRYERLTKATRPDTAILGKCNGAVPWIGYYVQEECNDQQSKLLIRSASNAYFSQKVTSIWLPEQKNPLRDLLRENQAQMSGFNEALFLMVYQQGDIWEEVRKTWSGAQAWAEYQSLTNAAPSPERPSLKDEEFAAFADGPMEIGGLYPTETKPTDDHRFHARKRRLDNLPDWLTSRVKNITLVHRLTEVVAQIGFTRFKPDMPEINGQYKRRPKNTPTLTDPEPITWLPAIENQGEGVFLEFCPDAIEAWLQQEGTQKRTESLKRGFALWKDRNDAGERQFPGAAFYMLHSLAHLLITAVSVSCGYSATALKERIYALPEKRGYGILIYTWSSASEGTLGGLIEVARRFEDSLRYARTLGELCSNDPVCAMHDPQSREEERYLSGAACHGCLLISETCCEQYNNMLDRALVVPTVECRDAAFFDLDDR
ncbi:DUF1998 domain-containing protein [Acanthopleuribacter pedis]|uniref:DUF1998 domain-containing protein n=1 Tax=Acanthopleuribacter pedis TaxID=442870 RepID=A0A8J7QBR4_9BACT|nr:DUF1998 domain-containing protein [Acanthopleuribacter pedis]MBO1323212.1 DUF1998 domain-containing protein [Acanthopleuribacter pedis]